MCINLNKNQVWHFIGTRGRVYEKRGREMLHSKIDLPVVPNSGHSKSKGSENVNVILFRKSTLIGKGYGNLELVCEANLSKKKKKKGKSK